MPVLKINLVVVAFSRSKELTSQSKEYKSLSSPSSIPPLLYQSTILKFTIYYYFVSNIFTRCNRFFLPLQPPFPSLRACQLNCLRLNDSPDRPTPLLSLEFSLLMFLYVFFLCCLFVRILTGSRVMNPFSLTRGTHSLTSLSQLPLAQRRGKQRLRSLSKLTLNWGRGKHSLKFLSKLMVIWGRGKRNLKFPSKLTVTWERGSHSSTSLSQFQLAWGRGKDRRIISSLSLTPLRQVWRGERDRLLTTQTTLGLALSFRRNNPCFRGGFGRSNQPFCHVTASCTNTQRLAMSGVACTITSV